MEEEDRIDPNSVRSVGAEGVRCEKDCRMD